ncbi:TonB-dependent receptor [Sphingobium sp. DC-2]|uniref:TonB-dependent receptor n=1 Tax=Sphingobium sp. DC-2 TaxID=1303256 RepID=UPI00068D5425|nr:TonB-dependent receptor [Sphingobium sp. DC-2]
MARAQEAPPSDSAHVNEAGIQEIVVTAARRAESAQRAALSIQALSSEDLSRAGVVQPEDISSIAPGVSIGAGGNYPQIYVRGVGSSGNNAYAEAAVAFHIDNVYVGRPWQQRGAFFDLDRVEVLKGPQGTLYGRNASGGAINLISARPRLGEYGGFVEMEAGNYDLMRGTAAANIPLGGTLALRAAGQIIHRNGYLSDGTDDDKAQSARLQLLYRPSDDFSLLLHASYQHVGGRGGGSTILPFVSGDPWTSNTDPAILAVYAADPVPILTRPTNQFMLDIKAYQLSAELTWNFGPATLTVIPAYRGGEYHDLHNKPGFPTGDNEKTSQLSLEARLSGESDRLKWVAGGYFFDENQDPVDGEPVLFADLGPTVSYQYPSARARSYAAFGQATFSLTDTFRMTGGLRYTREKKQLGGYSDAYSAPRPGCSPPYIFDPAAPNPPAFCFFSFPLTGSRTFKNLSWKAGAELDVGPRSLLYVNASTGFKSGGFFPAPAPDNSFGAEKVLAFEVGSKNRFLDNRLQVNVEGFYWRYTDQQLPFLKFTSTPGYLSQVVENAGKARIYGADADIVFQPTAQDNFSLKVQYLNTRYKQFTYEGVVIPSPPVTSCDMGPVVGVTVQVNCTGKPLIKSPKWSGTASYRHTFELPSGSSIEPGVYVQFESSSYQAAEYLKAEKQDAYAMLDADLTFYGPERRLSIAAYVQNITNKAVINQAFRHPVASGAPANPRATDDGLITVGLRAPRTYGVRLRAEF